jgi:hypothetical protein
MFSVFFVPTVYVSNGTVQAEAYKVEQNGQSCYVHYRARGLNEFYKYQQQYQVEQIHACKYQHISPFPSSIAVAIESK